MLETTSASVPIQGLTRPIKALVVADTQSLSLHWSAQRLAEVLKPRVEAEKPDVVFLLGDYSGITHGPAERLYNDWLRVDPLEAARILGGIEAPLGVYAVLGNHDWAEDGRAIGAALREGGAVLLENASAAIRTPAGEILLLVAGVDDPIGPQGARPDLALAGTDPSKPLIFLTHRPDEIANLPRPADLSLAGHTHGGQICFPLIGCPVSMTRLGLVRGLYDTPKGPILVSRGVGTAVFPFRLLSRPEILSLTLTPAPSAAPPPEQPR